MMKRVVAVAAACWFGMSPVFAQGTAEGSQLGFYIGKWTVEGQSRATPSGGFARMSGTQTCAWFSGGPALVCRETTQDAVGETDSIAILSYDPAKKQYTLHHTDNTGTVISATGTVAAGVWKWQGESRASDGKVTPVRYTYREGVGGAHTLDVEVMTKGAWSKTVGVSYKRAR